jgi:hypothetical protein
MYKYVASERQDGSNPNLVRPLLLAGATLAGVVYSFLNLSEHITNRLTGLEQ